MSQHQTFRHTSKNDTQADKHINILITKQIVIANILNSILHLVPLTNGFILDMI